jgi:hypothetical protein
VFYYLVSVSAVMILLSFQILSLYSAYNFYNILAPDWVDAMSNLEAALVRQEREMEQNFVPELNQPPRNQRAMIPMNR